jgi:hypothetical protein
MTVWRVVAVFLGVLLPALSTSDGRGQALAPTSRITPRAGIYDQPAISGDTVVWFDGRRAAPRSRIPGVDIYARNLHSGRQFRVTSSPTADPAGSLMVSNGTVLWDDCRHCRQTNGLPGYTGDHLFMRNLATGREFALPIRAYGQLGPWLLAGLAVWGKPRGRESVAFYAADAVNGQTRSVVTDSALRRVLSSRGHLVAWRDGYDIWGGDLLTGRVFIVARHAAGDGPLTDPVVSGRRAIWTRWPRQGPVSIDGVDLNSRRRFHVTTLPPNHFNPQFGPDKTIRGSVVVWVQARNPISSAQPDYTLMARDITSRQRLRLPTGPHDQGQPAVSGSRLVYVETRGPGGPGTKLIVQTRLPAGVTGVDPVWPMQFRGGG